MSAHNTARMMLSMAAKDIKAMRALADPNLVDDEVFGFHAQQAVEKSLKAWIIWQGAATALPTILRGFCTNLGN